MIDLDDLNELARIDTQDVLGAVERFADQVREGWEIGAGTADLPDADGVDSIVVLGMGGSGVSGDVTRAVVEPRLSVPFQVIKSYGPLPEWVGRNSLVFAVSYSGSTEETIAAVDEAHERGARIVTISSGGPLEEKARQFGLAHVKIPTGLQPRASLGYLTLPLIAVLVRVGLVPDLQDDLDETVELLGDLAGRCHRKIDADANPAKQLATKLANRIPVIYGGHGVGEVAAYRFKCDLNEYGKTPAFWNVFPELDHNEIVGWKELSEITSAHFVLVLLRDPEDHERVGYRFDITRDLIKGNLAEVIELEAEGRSKLTRLLYLVLLTQLAAIYVGLSYGIDPGPVEAIMKLKNELSQR